MRYGGLAFLVACGSSPDGSGGVRGGHVVINEVMVRASGGPEDWVELYNAGDEPQSTKDWEVAGEGLAPIDSIGPGAYAVVEFDQGGLPSGLVLELLAPDRVVDRIDLPLLADGWSWGRVPDGVGAFEALPEPTPGASNGDTPSPGACGDGEVNRDEACDGPDAALCQELGFASGVAECSVDCLRPFVASCEPHPSTVSIEAVHTNSPDAVLLVNAGPDPVDISGWTLVDRLAESPERAWSVPAGTVLAAGEQRWFPEGAGTLGFGLARPEYLTMRDGALVVDYFEW